ncbi:MAG: type II toxin-antitoxin system RelE/ParE family toxin [Cyanosarcina radialis HA8281-LM2]|jgi:toxin ParE1/3/4|nr:type II toxin-antitoxin system RelE/ParE family toxin [Cyanosarcina radialis HA8281-LM2]
MSNICQFTPTASRDLESILDYVAHNSSFDVAERLLTKINSTCYKLATFPSMGRRRDELASALRSFPVESYLIFYRSTKAGVEILRVVSGYQELTTLFLDLNG